MHNKSKRIRFVSLGCPKNLVDAEVMMGQLTKAGYHICTDKEILDNPTGCDIFVINTCCFIKEADEESRNLIRQAIQMRNSGSAGKNGYKVIVSGCLAQRSPKQLAKDFNKDIDGIISVSQRDKIVPLCDSLIQRNMPVQKSSYWTPPAATNRIDNLRLRITPKHYAYLRIAEGCNNRCTYCIIPDIHGAYRSKPADKVIEEAHYLAAQGVKELNLIAQDTTSYGWDLKPRVLLPDLLKTLAKIEGFQWIRLLYTHPAYFTDELIDTIKETDKIVKYVDLPIQHISDKILSAMHRHTTAKEIKELIKKIRKKIPGVFIRSTVIVGFPGETKADFNKLADFISKTKFERLGAFVYSKEKDTPACQFQEQIPDSIKKKRLDEVMTLQQKIAFANNASLKDSFIPVIIDGPYIKESTTKHGQEYVYIGRTYGDAPEVDGNIILKSVYRLKNGDIMKAKIVGNDNYDLIGIL